MHTSTITKYLMLTDPIRPQPPKPFLLVHPKLTQLSAVLILYLGPSHIYDHHMINEICARIALQTVEVVHSLVCKKH